MRQVGFGVPALNTDASFLPNMSQTAGTDFSLMTPDLTKTLQLTSQRLASAAFRTEVAQQLAGREGQFCLRDT